MTLEQNQNIRKQTVVDSINRVLDRLDNGEKLIRGDLTNGNGQFCVLGLFAHEAGLFELYNISQKIYDATYDFYGIRRRMNIEELPTQLYDALHDSPLWILDDDDVALYSINDMLLAECYDDANSILAELIRSGVVFEN